LQNSESQLAVSHRHEQGGWRDETHYDVIGVRIFNGTVSGLSSQFGLWPE